jgi:hypothetical protein
MATPWVNSVQRTSTLTVFRAANASGWASLLNTAITRFNALSGMLTCNVAFNLTTTPPDPNTLAGANVQFALANGNFSYKAFGVSGSGVLSATASSGTTQVVQANGACVKAFIFLPARVQQHNFMKICMIVHELVHAAGLSNSDHSSDADPDIFCSSLTPSGSGVQCGLFANRVMPPIWMTNRTAAKIQALWP